MKERKIPVRQCLGCNEHKPKPEMIRVVRDPEGKISLDLTGKKSGRQINRMIGKLTEKGATIVPLKLYFNNHGKLKVLLGIGYGKNKVDKRETIKKREWDKSKARLLKG